MDLRLFWAVTKRFKRVAIGGFVAAVILAILAYGTPGPHGLTPHGSVTWESQAQLLITQSSGAYNRANPQAITAGLPGYISGQSPVYAQIANGDAVQSAVRAAKIPGLVEAQEGVDPLTGAYMPWITLTATAPTASDAVKLSQRTVTVLQNYLLHEEEAGGVPESQRISLQVVKSGMPPEIAASPKPTIAILVFIAIISATIMVMFSLENHDPMTAAALGRVPGRSAGGTGRFADSRADGGSNVHHDRMHRGADERPPTLDALIKGR
jgi:hypothetical protein